MPDIYKFPRSLGGVLDWRPSETAKSYLKNLAVNPLSMAALQGPLGYLLGHYAAAPVAEYFSPSDNEKAKQERRRKYGLLGLGAGLLPPAALTMGRWMNRVDPETLQTMPDSGMSMYDSLMQPFYKGSSDKSAGYVPAYPGVQNLIMADPILSPYEKAVAMQSVSKALEQSDRKGWFTVGDLVRGAIGAGLGYGAAKLTGTVLGVTFGMSPETQKRLNQLGIVGGILANTGVLKV